jgi:hypothetical protein
MPHIERSLVLATLILMLSSHWIPASGQYNSSVIVNQNPFGMYLPGVTAANPNLVPPYPVNPDIFPSVTPDLTLPSRNPYVVIDQFGNAVVNPNYLSNPVITTPIVPNPIVPTPLVPNINVSPNGPASPGTVLSNPLFLYPYGYGTSVNDVLQRTFPPIR